MEAEVIFTETDGSLSTSPAEPLKGPQGPLLNPYPNRGDNLSLIVYSANLCLLSYISFY